MATYKIKSPQMEEKVRMRTRRSERHGRLLAFVILAAQALLTLASFTIIAIRNEIHVRSIRLWQIIGFLVFIPAFSIWISARVELSKHSSFAVMPVIPPKLVQTGSYSYLMHPIYVSSFLYVMAYFLVISSVRGILALVLIVAPLQYVRARVECLRLKEKFHYKYEVYCEEVQVRYSKSGARTAVTLAFALLTAGAGHLFSEVWPEDMWELLDIEIFPSYD